MREAIKTSKAVIKKPICKDVAPVKPKKFPVISMTEGSFLNDTKDITEIVATIVNEINILTSNHDFLI
jgi:hypothetical protein